MNINTRIIRNTIKALREVKSAQETLMYEDCIRRRAAAHDLSLDECGENVFEALGEDDRNEVRRFFPLAFLPEDAQSLPLDLETCWEKTYRMMISSLEGDDVDEDLQLYRATRGRRPRAFFHVDASGQAIGRLGALGAALEEGSPVAARSDALPFVSVKREGEQPDARVPNSAAVQPTDPSTDDGASSSSSSSSEWEDEPSTRKRGRSEGAPDSPMHPGMEWLSTLPNEMCVSFVRKCIDQSRALKRGPIALASGFRYSSMGSLDRLERCVALSETKLQGAQGKVSARPATQTGLSPLSTTLGTKSAAEAATGQATNAAKTQGRLLAPPNTSAAPASEPAVIPASAFVWNEVPLDSPTVSPEGNALERRADSYVFATQEAAITVSPALLVGICAPRSRFSCRGNLRVPEGVKALLQIPFRGELHVGSVSWQLQ